MQVVLDNLPVVLVLLAGLFAPLAGWFATRRSRQPVVWFAFGALLGPLALLLLALAPPGRCPSCETRITGWPGWCAQCGMRLRGSISKPGGRPSRATTAPPIAREATTAPPIAREATTVPSLDTLVGRRVRLTSGGTITSLSQRSFPELAPDPAVAASQVPGESTAGEVLSTGIYLSGNAQLEIGACYALSRAGERWRVFGPVDAGQITVRHEGSIHALEVTAMDDRVILSSGEGRSSVAIVLRPIGGMRAADLERALTVGPDHGGSSGVAS